MDELNISEFLGSNCSEVDFSRQRFKGGELKNCSMGDKNLQEVTIQLCVFDNVSFYDCQMSCGEFRDCAFISSDFSMSHVYKAKFIDCVFVDCKFIKWELLDTVIKNSCFVRCDFKLADFSSGEISESRFVLPINPDSLAKENVPIIPSSTEI
jgi:uncharacterized protein YjbI with pentapeptide repeats